MPKDSASVLFAEELESTRGSSDPTGLENNLRAPKQIWRDGTKKAASAVLAYVDDAILYA